MPVGRRSGKPLPVDVREQHRADAPLRAGEDPETASPEVQEAFNDLVITETHLKKRKLEREREEVEDFFRAGEERATAEHTAHTRAQQQAAAEATKRQWSEYWQE